MFPIAKSGTLLLLLLLVTTPPGSIGKKTLACDCKAGVGGGINSLIRNQFYLMFVTLKKLKAREVKATGWALTWTRVARQGSEAGDPDGADISLDMVDRIMADTIVDITAVTMGGTMEDITTNPSHSTTSHTNPTMENEACYKMLFCCLVQYTATICVSLLYLTKNTSIN